MLHRTIAYSTETLVEIHLRMRIQQLQARKFYYQYVLEYACVYKLVLHILYNNQLMSISI